MAVYDSKCALEPLSIRGAGVKGRLLVYQAERFTAYMDVRWDESGAATVTGQIIGAKQTLPTQVGLWDEDLHIPVAMTEMTDLGFFVLPNVQPRRSMLLTLGDDRDATVRWLAFPIFANKLRSQP
jgi:hypothetical protein